MTLQIGHPAPDFDLRDQHGQRVTLASFRDAKAVAVMFYPYAFSRVCTGEMHGVRDRLSLFSSADVALVAISCDPVYSLRAFAEQDGLTFPLLSDFWPHGEVARAYDVFDEQRGCADRSTFVVDKDGVLQWMVHNDMPQARDLEEQARVLGRIA